MNRRHFLHLLGSGAVASGVAASAGFDLSHFLSWLTRNPRWSFPTSTSRVLTANVTEYFDYISMSDLAVGTALDPLLNIYYNPQALDNFHQASSVLYFRLRESHAA